MNDKNLPLHLPNAGPEADELIAVHLMGWTWDDERCPTCGLPFSPAITCTLDACGSRATKAMSSRDASIPRWTRNKMLALRLIERLRLDGWLVSIVFAPPGLPFLMGNCATVDPEIAARVKCELADGHFLMGKTDDAGELVKMRLGQFGLADTLSMAVCRAAWKTVSMS